MSRSRPAAPRRRQVLATIAAALALAVLAVLGYRLRPLLSGSPEAAQQVLPVPDCDLHAGPCQVALPGGGRLRFEITPHSIPLLKPLQLQVTVDGPTPVRTVEVDFAGVGMFMGYNRPRLEPAGAGRFTGEAVLPVCSWARMPWEARVLLHRPDGLLVVPFRFETRR